MNKFKLIIILSLLSGIAKANCDKIEEYKLLLSVHGSNYANASTTQTPEGGAYKKKELLCKKSCKVLEQTNGMLKYEPSHPDANNEGYVEYPVITADIERAAISTYAKALQGLSRACRKSFDSIIDNGPSSFALDYKSGTIRSDIFNFNSNSKVVSWVRQYKDGKSQILNF